MTMNTIRYFGMLAERIGLDEETVGSDGPRTVDDLRAELHRRHPALLGLSFRIAVDRELATDQAIVPPGAEVALLPPFAGG